MVSQEIVKGFRFAAVVAIFLGLSAPTTVADELPVQPFDAVYSLTKGMLAIGETRHTLAREGERITFRSVSRPKGIAAWFVKDVIEESSELFVEQNRFYPLRYSRKQSGGKRKKNTQIALDWDQLMARAVHNGQAFEYLFPTDVQDKLMFQLQIMADLPEGKTEWHIPVVKRHKVTHYHVKATAGKLIKTPYGEFNTVKVSRILPPGVKEEKIVMWCAKRLGYLPVQIDFEDRKGITFHGYLKKLTGIHAQPVEQTQDRFE